MEDKRDLLKQPLHGIYIPIALMIVGTLMLDVSYMPYTIAFIVIMCSINFYSAWSRRCSIDPVKWTELEMIDRTVISKNSAIYRFQLKHQDEVLDIPTGHHLACVFMVDGKDEVRYYSPISNKYDAGFFDILVKSYPNGKVSSRFPNLREGQTVKFRGPVGRLEYKTNMAKEIGLIAGGSGITPILQVITEVITTPADTTKISLIYANNTLNDILLRDEIDELSKNYPNFKVHYTLTEPPANWEGSTGFVSKEMITKYLPKPSEENRLFICGPPEMKKSLIEISQELGWDKTSMKSDPNDQVFCF
ncbi:cytochrome b5 reductase [Yamadazyma tenuis]|uniref:NADH-cytochrome b5 reductase n=1 Tax=Candida tenuis (strain ATCC 10573 / BCRC 21748 / CBS 615 / JCM 9827 / NBRC 10315 / NRRL Y-1498 / VKM Y-70) TaxID=590646 RepID=G3AYV9_CANTC|nr:ferredoxin reductase-like protein [Yamadazyma tenuis ATCC 10573]EGV65942.1 ferredoxin reductase-like protein [Yamadazyma tenuis ATCC 10573]WEJ95727.1 cytochrome b5 reductase [Yamadazyma tenuis]